MAAFVDVSVLLSCVMLYFYFITRALAEDTVQKELLARIEALEIQGREQTHHIKQIVSKLDIQDAKRFYQQQTIVDYKQRVKSLEQTVENMQAKSDIEVKEQQEANVVDGANVKPQANVSIHGQIMNVRQQRLVLDDDGAVAFHAVIKSNRGVNHIGGDQKIVFADVMINLGVGYHNLQGLFIAPRSGLYLFSTSIMSDKHGTGEITVHLMKNGNILTNGYSHSDSGVFYQVSVTVVTQLVVGDEVWVSLYGPPNTSIWGNYYSSFMGCLIIPV